MLRMPLATSGHRRTGIRPSLALALALAGGAVIGTVALSEPALAQRDNRQQEQTLSRDFQPHYQAIADATNTTGDYAAAKADVPAMIAAIDSEYDRFFAGNILLQLGTKSSDRALQKQGLELMLQSGQASPENNGQFHYFLGGFAYEAGDYAGALREAQAALEAGFTGNFAQQQDPWGLVADSYFKLNRHQEGIDFLKKTIADRSAAGQPVREQWALRALAAAYEQNMTQEAADLSALLVESNPNPTTWQQALQVVSAMVASDEQARLDVLRLMALTDSLSQRAEFERYVTTLDPRVLPSEVGKVLEAGVQKGAFTSGDPFYTETKRMIDGRVAQEAALAADYAAEAASAADGKPAFNAGDIYLSLGDYAKAEEMFELALQKGGVDRNQVLTRIGIAQVHQSKLAEAKSSFAQVSGAREPVARMWTAYIETRA